MKGSNYPPGYGDAATPEPKALTISSDIASRLLDGEKVTGITGEHTLEDVLQHLYDNADDTERLNAALQSIALGADYLPLASIRKLVTRAADEYAQKIEADVIAAIAEKKRDEKAEWLAAEQESNRFYESV